MTPFIEEARRMLRLAERDYETFSILRAHPDAKLAPTCFHAQQSVEKAMKAVLMARQANFRYTHDLEELFKLLAEAETPPPHGIDALRRLSPFAVELRYDDQIIPLLTREEAETIAGETVRWARGLVNDAGGGVIPPSS